MAPKDDLFPDPSPPSPEPEAPQPPNSPGAPDLAAAVAAALNQQLSPVAEALAKVNERLGALEQPKAPSGPPPSTNANDFIDRLVANGEATISDVARREIARTVVPAVKQQLEQAKEMVLESHQEAVDKEFGRGTWADHFAKPISEAIDGLPLEMQASKRHVREAVSAVYGRLYMDPELRAKMEGKRGDVAKELQSPTMLSGFGRPKPSQPDSLDADQKAFIGALQRSGFEIDEAAYREAQNLGGSESAWRAHFAKTSKEAR